jgi:hypothetical protein
VQDSKLKLEHYEIQIRASGSVVVKALYYKREGGGFDTR